MRHSGHHRWAATRSNVCRSNTRHPSREATMCRLTNVAALALYLTTLVFNQLNARDDGRLASGRGLCCSFADGATVQDVDWDTQDGHYRVRIYGQWIVVPDAAVVTEPNRFGP